MNINRLSSRILGLLILLINPALLLANESLTLSGSDSAMDHYIFSNILKGAYLKLGTSTQFTPLPSSRSLVNANHGLSDGEIARIKGINKRYKNLMRVPIPIMTSGIYALSLKKLPVEDWKDISQYKIAYRRGIQIIKNALDEHKIQSSVVNKDLELMHFLLRGRTDIILQDKGLAIASLTQLQAEGVEIRSIQFLEPPLMEVNLYHYLNKKHQPLLQGISQVLKDMKKSGELDRKIRHYFAQLMSNSSAPKETLIKSSP